MKLVAGSYERFLWGWEVKEKQNELHWTFAYPAHIGPIKCIASCGAVVATGGADDTIKVFDLNAQKDMGSLYKHEGAVTCLAFHGPRGTLQNHPTHLLSGSEDGTICIWDTDSWIHLTSMKTKKGQKTSVNDLSIHPSGIMALSVERNANMKMWNLTKGRCSFTTKLASEAAIVKFFPQAGESYALVLGTVVEIRNAETGRTIHSLQHDKKVFCTAQQEDNMLVTGGEDSVVRAWDTRSGKEAWSVAHAHTNRIRGVAMMGSSLETNDDSNGLSQLVASASSDGMVKVWDPRMVGSEEGATPVPLMEAETKARLTCLVGCGVPKKSGERDPEGVCETQGVADEQSLPSSGDPKQPTRKQKRKKNSKTASIDADLGFGEKLSAKRQKPNPKRKPKLVAKLPAGSGLVSPVGTSQSHLKRKKSGMSDRQTPSNRSPPKRPKPSPSQRLGKKFSKLPDGGKQGNSSGKKRRKLHQRESSQPSA